MNTFMNQMQNDANFDYTENGGLAHKSTMSAIYDLFAFGAAYRSRSDEDVLLLFKNAFEENEILALKCLFWIRDCRGGAGERRFFDLCIKWLANKYPNRIKKLLPYIPEYGRWDEMYIFVDTPLEADAFAIMKQQLAQDMSDIMTGKENIGISLLGKWLKSENASSAETKKLGTKTRQYFGLSSAEYRKTLSRLREQIRVLEKLMSANRWDEIDFAKIPSKAGLIYKNAFARRDIIAQKYEAFAKDKNTKVNADVLYPYEIVAKALNIEKWWWDEKPLSETDRAMINKYWDCLPNYFGDKECSMMCVVDTSGSMVSNQAAAPINVAISLGLYCAERLRGPFANHYISFSSKPQLIKTEGIDFVDKVKRIYKTNLCENTDLEAVFNLLLSIAITPGVKKSDIPKTIVVISDMEIDDATYNYYWSDRASFKLWTSKNSSTMMEKMRTKWAAYGLELPKLVYWNVAARNNRILDMGPNVSFVSGMSPTLFKQVITGKTGMELMLETICSDRYINIE